MKTFSFKDEFICRYKKFLMSNEYLHVSEYSKSKYWESFADQVGVEIDENSIKVKGKSGFYIPQRRGLVNVIRGAFKKLYNEPWRIVEYLIHRVLFKKFGGSLVSYGEAFNDVMDFDPESETRIPSRNNSLGLRSKHRINFAEVAKKDNSYISMDEIKKRHSSNYSVNNQIIYSYYIYNIINAYAVFYNPLKILEIGAGNGNLLSVMHDNVECISIIDVDLPETLSHAMLYISELYPNARILMPHEAQGKNFDDYDFVFLTPGQIGLLNDESIDISINIFSFQEMTHPQIKDYFDLIQRCSKNNSLFMTSNRVEKFLPSADNSEDLPNRFSEYPWNSNNEVLAYEICRFMHQVNFNSFFIRLEKIKK